MLGLDESWMNYVESFLGSGSVISNMLKNVFKNMI